MAIRYKKVALDGTVTCIKKWDDAQSDPKDILLIPIAADNTDYQEWQVWDAIDGNTTEDAD